MRKLLALMVLAACSDPVPPGDAMIFRDNFDSLAPGWTIPESGVRVEDGELRMSTGVGPTPEAEYTLPTPFGPGWDFKVNAGVAAGSPCSAIEISTGHARRHTWALDLDTERDYWGLQVRDGDSWETVGSSIGGDEVSSPITARLLVDGNDVGLWLDDVQVVDAVIQDAAPNAVAIRLAVDRCQIVAGVVAYDWVEIKELQR